MSCQRVTNRERANQVVNSSMTVRKETSFNGEVFWSTLCRVKWKKLKRISRENTYHRILSQSSTILLFFFSMHISFTSLMSKRRFSLVRGYEIFSTNPVLWTDVPHVLAIRGDLVVTNQLDDIRSSEFLGYSQVKLFWTADVFRRWSE